jgi:myo-inositol-1-phosphate synthase
MGKLGVAVIGLNGAVATTAAAGIAAIRAGSNDLAGLPLADRQGTGLHDYRDIEFAGWDLNGRSMAEAAQAHEVVPAATLSAVREELAGIRPWPAIGSTDFCANIDGDNKMNGGCGHRAAVQQIKDDLDRLRETRGVDDLVVINLASTERLPNANGLLERLDAFEEGLDANAPEISPAMLYAYAAIDHRVPYANFTPSVAADAKALVEFAEKRGVPIAGKDGKTGQTMMKTVIAPALRDRALHVDGWFSTNILGNSDGLALDDPKSLASKVNTKKRVLDQILGYPVEDHIVMIHYYRPRGDAKEAWDNIDVSGFLGQKMQIKVNFLCQDSILAAPLVIEIARVLDLAAKRGDGGVQEQMSLFFKLPQTRGGRQPEHEFSCQVRMLDAWLEQGTPN